MKFIFKSKPWCGRVWWFNISPSPNVEAPGSWTTRWAPHGALWPVVWLRSELQEDA